MKTKNSLEYGVNRGSGKQFLISVAVAILFVYIILTSVFGTLSMELHIVPKIILTIMILEFTWRKIINPISEKTVEVMQNMTTGKSIKQSIIETIPKEKEELNTTKNKVV